MSSQPVRPRSAFTLIELLIVVAIIAILAAIAVPNFLEAQTRAKIARAQGDLRTIAVGLEAYAVDHSKFPMDRAFADGRNVVPYDWYTNTQVNLTTPVAYLTSVALQDPFINEHADPEGWASLGPRTFKPTYRYQNTGYRASGYRNWGDWVADANPALLSGRLPRGGFVLTGYGPAGVTRGVEWISAGKGTLLSGGTRVIDLLYDATNGTVSDGGIYRLGGSTTDS